MGLAAEPAEKGMRRILKGGVREEDLVNSGNLKRNPKEHHKAVTKFKQGNI